MRSVLRLLLATLLGVGLGLLTANLAVEAEFGFGRIGAGPWRGAPRAGAITADPYTKAVYARSGEIAIGGGESVVFVATTDSAGRRLDAACAYSVAGEAPRARFFTLAATRPDGRLMDNPSGRLGFTSLELTRDSGGNWRVAVAPRARSGDWLPIAAEGRFQLVLRIYDTPLATGADLLTPVLPEILREACP